MNNEYNNFLILLTFSILLHKILMIFVYTNIIISMFFVFSSSRIIFLSCNSNDFLVMYWNKFLVMYWNESYEENEIIWSRISITIKLVKRFFHTKITLNFNYHSYHLIPIIKWANRAIRIRCCLIKKQIIILFRKDTDFNSHPIISPIS